MSGTFSSLKASFNAFGKLRLLAALGVFALVLTSTLWVAEPSEASSHLQWNTDHRTWPDPNDPSKPDFFGFAFQQGRGSVSEYIAGAKDCKANNITHRMQLKSDPTVLLSDDPNWWFDADCGARLRASSEAFKNYMAETVYEWVATDNANPPNSIKVDFTLSITATIPTKPYAGGQARDGTMILGWGGVEHVNGYEYNLSESTSFSSNGWKTVPNSNGATDRHTFADGSDDDLELKDNKRYYVKVRGVNGPGGGVKGPESDTVYLRNVVDPSFTDYDTDDDGLIEISNLAQLNAIRLDLDGDGLSTSSDQYMGLPDPNPGNEGKWIVGVFLRAPLNMGCPDSGCIGYELTEDLDFDEDGNGVPEHNDGQVNGWRSLGGGTVDTKASGRPYVPGLHFTAIFDGNGHTIKNLIRGRYNGERDSVSSDGTKLEAGLFGIVGESGVVRNVHLTNVNVVGATTSTDSDVTKWGGRPIGALVSENRGRVENSTASGRVHRDGAFNLHLKSTYHNVSLKEGDGYRFWDELNAHMNNASMGGLVGYNRGRIIGSGANVDVRGPGIVGGLAGVNHKVSGGEDGRDNGQIVNSYARGYVEVDGTSMGGGLVGYNTWGNIIGSYASGDVNVKERAAIGENVAVGGLAGVLNGRGTLVSKSYATGDVTNRGNNGTRNTHHRHFCYAGGLVGHAYHTDWRSNATGNQMKIEDSYSTGNVSYDSGISGGEEWCNVGVMVGFVNNGTKLQLYDSYGVGRTKDQTTGAGTLPGVTQGIVGYRGQGPGYLHPPSHGGADPKFDIHNSYYEIQRTSIPNRTYGSHKNDQDMRLATEDDRRGVYSGWSTNVWDFRDDKGHTYPEIKVDWDGDGVATSAEFAAEGDDLGAQPHSYLWLTASEASHPDTPSLDLRWTRGDDNQGGFKWQWAYTQTQTSIGPWTAFLNQDDQGIGRNSISTRFREMDNGETWFMRVRAVDEDGDQVGLISNQVHITFADSAPSFEGKTVSDQVYVQGKKINDLVLPTPTGGNGTLTYLLSPHSDGNPVLPQGLNWDANTRTISGTPMASSNETEFTWRVTDGDTINAESAELKFKITVKTPLAFDETLSDQTFFVNTPVDLQLPAASGGIGTIEYTLAGMPEGLSFDPQTRRLSGASEQAVATKSFVYRAATTGDYGETVQVTPNVTVFGCTFGTQTIDDLVYTVGERVQRHDLALPEGSCSLENDSAVTRSLYKEADPSDNSLPLGIAIGHNVTSGEQFLQGTPISPSTSVTYVYRANPSSRVGYPILKFRIYSKLTLPAIDNPNKSYVAGVAIPTLTLPASTGGVGTAREYTIDKALPDGLSFNANNRQITGTPTEGSPETTYTYMVTDDETDATKNSAETTFTISVAQTTLPHVQHRLMQPGETVPDWVLPEASGGTAPYSYSLVNFGEQTLSMPAGLVYNSATRTISGTPAESYETQLYRYTATDMNGVEDSVTFNIRASLSGYEKPSFESVSPASRILTFSVGQQFTSDALPKAQDGDSAELTYTITGELPFGLSFNAEQRTISGTPTTEETKVVTYTATDPLGVAGNDSASLQITIVVEADTSPEFEESSIPKKTFRVNRRITGINPPALKDGANEPLTYSIEPPLPSGLEIDAGTGAISGTPSEAAHLTYTVTVTDRDSDTGSFKVEIEVLQRSTEAYIRYIEPVFGEITMSPGEEVRFRLKVIGLQDEPWEIPADSGVVFTWSETKNGETGSRQLAGNGRSIVYTAPSTPGHYTIAAALDQDYCESRSEIEFDAADCTAEFSVRVQRASAATPEQAAPVNPSGAIPSLLSDDDGEQYAVFTPEEGGSFDGEGFSINVEPGAVPNGELVGIRIVEGEAISTDDEDTPQRYTLAGSTYHVSAVDASGSAVSDYLLEAPGATVCVPLPDVLRSNISEVDAVSLAQDGGMTILSTTVSISGEALHACATLSQLPATIAVGTRGIPTAPPTSDVDPLTPDTGGTAPSNVIILLTLVLGAVALYSGWAVARYFGGYRGCRP